MSGMIRSMPGRSSPANDTPRSTTSHLRLRAVAEAVEREIHADLADAAERREDEFVGGRPSGAHLACGRRESTSPAVIALDDCRRQRAASAGPCRRASRSVPASSRSGSRTAISPPMPAARASQSARIAAKPAPASHCASRAAIARDERAQAARPASRRRRAPQDRSPDTACRAGWCAQLTPMPIDRRRAAADALAFDQDAGELGAVEQQVVRPFERRAAAPSRGAHRARPRRASASAATKHELAATARPAPDRSSSRLA